MLTDLLYEETIVGVVIKKVIWRPIQEEELEMVMQWRMSPEITKYMRSDPVLNLELQKEWFEKCKHDQYNKTFMIEVNDIPSGIINITDIDRSNEHCSWGYYLAARNVRSLELAMLLEWNVYDYAFDILKLHKVTGEVFSDNKAVIRLHQLCGSIKEGELKDHIKKNGKFFDVVLMAITDAQWSEEKKKRHYKKVDIIE